MARQSGMYSPLIERIFERHYNEGSTEVSFEREELVSTAAEFGITLPKNLGDVVYSFRYRAALPESIRQHTPDGRSWIIRPDGKAKYKFALAETPRIIPNSMIAETKIPDATPGIVSMYAFGDEQGLLTKLRYNRLIDVFSGITCYSLQNHLRTTVPEMGQVETDEIYVGVDHHGAQYVIPIQAKGGTDQLGIVQIEQDIALCRKKFPQLICRPVAAQFMEDNLIALFLFEEVRSDISLLAEKHYRLVPPDQLTAEDLEIYRKRFTDCK